MADLRRLCKAAFVALGLALTAPGLATAADRALLIGIGTYESLPPELFLHGPKNDLVVMQDLVTKTLGFAPENVKVLADKDASRDAILKTLDEFLVKGTKEGERVYLYFSGHGLQVKDDNKDEDDELDEALAPFDIKDVDGAFTQVIRDDEIETFLKSVSGRSVTLVIDACHSGTITRSLSNVPGAAAGARYLPQPFAKSIKKEVLTRGLRIDVGGVVDKPEVAKESGVTTWSAAAPYQVAWDDTRLPVEERHGVFTQAFVAGYTPKIADSNGNGLISNAELFEYVKAQSQAYCAAEKNCENLDPQLELINAALGTSVAKPDPAYAAPAPAATETVAAAPVYVEPEKPAETATYVAPPVATYVDANAAAYVGDIVGKAEDGDVTVSIDVGAKLKKGQVFKISVSSKRGGHLILLDVSKDGKATQFFPNEIAQKITPLLPKSTLTIPDDYYGFDFEADGNGESVLVAIVVSDPIDLKGVAPATRGLKEASKTRDTLGDIIGTLQKTWTKDLDNRGVTWSIGTLKYSVE